jgi:hypothetical protein
MVIPTRRHGSLTGPTNRATRRHGRVLILTGKLTGPDKRRCEPFVCELIDFTGEGLLTVMSRKA